MAYDTGPVWNSMGKNIRIFKKKIVRDVLLAVLVVKIAGILIKATAGNFETSPLMVYVSAWAFLYSRYTSIMSLETVKQGFSVGIMLLLALSAPQFLLYLVINNAIINSPPMAVMTVAAGGVVMSLFLVIVFPMVIQFIIPKEHPGYKPGGTYKKPFFIFPSLLLAVVVFLFVFRFVGYLKMLCGNPGGKFLLGTTLDAMFFFSAICLASLFVSLIKEGDEGM